jgi:NCS1 family nucleobase:cation symporter-1
MLASGLIDQGMDWKQAVLTVFLGNLIVLIPMVLNAHAGTKYGIPFPVYCRASFGTQGANLPAILRALVACGWFGIQAWIGGAAIYVIAAKFFPALDAPSHHKYLGVTLPQLACFFVFWLLNVIVIWRGIDTIRILLNIKAPLLIALGLLLLGWAYQRAGGFGPILSQPSQFAPGEAKAGQFLVFFVPALTAMVGFWATLSLNIPDFSRYAKSQRDQILGQALGLPTTMGLYAFIGVAVTSATVVIYHEKIWDPVQVLTKIENKSALVVAMLALSLATLATNIAANVVSPANDFSHLSPKRISFRTGGLITAVVGVLIMPWKLIESSHGYIFTWLVAYSALLGAVGGILICDYWLLRRARLSVADLFDPNGRYAYAHGTNWRAVAAFVIGLGFNLYLGLVANDALWHTLPIIGFVLYLLFSWRQLIAAWSRPAP